MITLSKFIYDLFLGIYYATAWTLSLFRQKEKLWISGRKETFNRLKKIENNSSEKRIWFHCSSLGEFEQARPLIESIKSKKPDSRIFLSFFSPSGYEIRKNYPLADCVFYLPFDSKKNAARLIDILKPDIVFWTKYDFWYYMLTDLKNRKVDTILFSANFRAEQIFFKSYGAFFREILQCFSNIFVQNETSKKLLNTIGVKSTIAEDTRFDRVYENALNSNRIEKIELFLSGSKVLVAGSTWPKDEHLIKQSLEILRENNFKIIIAPHEIDEQSMSRTRKIFESEFVLFSKLEKESAKNVLIIDNIGMLSSIYRYADLVYVGGGFNKSVHNVLEPAAHGKAMIFGPNHHKSNEAKELVVMGIASIVNSNENIATTALTIMNGNIENQKGNKAKGYVKSKTGGTEKIISNCSI